MTTIVRDIRSCALLKKPCLPACLLSPRFSDLSLALTEFASTVPYQRIYLLHGPPGNGKSSFLQALAILFSMPFFYLELANKQLTLEGLRNMLSDSTLQSRCILALEDAESVFKAVSPAAEAAQAEREAERLERLFTQQQAQQSGGGGGGATAAAQGQAAALAAH